MADWLGVDMAERICSFPDCDSRQVARGFCGSHYSAWRRAGGQPLPRQSFEERFWAKVEKTETCWLWRGRLDPLGYGRTDRNRKPILAHRASYELTVGPIPAGHDLDHKCHNATCVRPDHLQPVRRRQNQENRAGATRGSQTGVRGVSWAKHMRKYRASAGSGGKVFHGGYFETIAEAEAAAIELRNRLMTNNLTDRAAN